MTTEREVLEVRWLCEHHLLAHPECVNALEVDPDEKARVGCAPRQCEYRKKSSCRPEVLEVKWLCEHHLIAHPECINASEEDPRRCEYRTKSSCRPWLKTPLEAELEEEREEETPPDWRDETAPSRIAGDIYE